MAWHSTWNEEPERESGFLADRGGMFPPGVKLILLLTVGVFLLQMLSPVWMAWLIGWGGVTARSVVNLQAWRLVTYMFLHGSTDHILINMFIFWMLGSMFERQIGTRRFLALYFAAGIFGGLCEAGFNCLMYMRYGPLIIDRMGHTYLDVPAVGASAGVAGILVAFATLNPRALFLFMFIIPIEARWMALIYVLIETRHVVSSLWYGTMDNVANAAHLGGMIVGFAWMKWGGRLADFWRRTTPRPPERFLDRDAAEEQAEMDRILDKIHRSGLGSLSLRERMFMQEMSRKYHDKF